MAQRALLIVLDGFGLGRDSPFNAIGNARMPFYRDLMARYPHSELLTHGAAVGLPDGVMGNSEVGHMTLGSGRILYQDLTRISNSIQDKSFEKRPVLVQTIQKGAATTGRVHLMGLLSDGGVHSHIEHLEALLELAVRLQVPEVYVHAFLDGRDTPPESSLGYLERLLRHPAFSKNAKLASLCGRYYAMDRDQRWERIERATQVLRGQTPPIQATALGALQASHAAGKTDEFVEPVLLLAEGGMRDGDSVVFFNYRSDRAREITQALTERDLQLSAFTGMTQYDAKLTRAAVAFEPQSLTNIFGELLEARGLKQLRTAETEKYAHVTFFFNCGRERPFAGEERVLVASPKDVPTYDLKPEMSAFEVAREARIRIEAGTFDFVLMNFANADMVGHTGNYEAAVRAMEALDACLAEVIGAASKNGYSVLVTADHGNAEEMRDDQGRLHTQHTLNPVPALWIAPGTAVAPKSARKALKDGSLRDVMPTLCELMGLPIPPEVTGKSLLPAGEAP